MLAALYQGKITQSITRQPFNQSVLMYGLSDIMAWRQRFAAADSEGQRGVIMYLDWLEHVQKPVGEYGDWLSDYLDTNVFCDQPTMEGMK